MTAIKTANIVEGNLAQEPKYFPEGQYVARIVFRIMHTDRRLNPQTNQWEDGRTTAVDVNFYGPHRPRPSSTARASSPTSSSTSVAPAASKPILPVCRNTPTRHRNRDP